LRAKNTWTIHKVRLLALMYFCGLDSTGAAQGPPSIDLSPAQNLRAIRAPTAPNVDWVKKGQPLHVVQVEPNQQARGQKITVTVRPASAEAHSLKIGLIALGREKDPIAGGNRTLPTILVGSSVRPGVYETGIPRVVPLGEYAVCGDVDEKSRDCAARPTGSEFNDRITLKIVNDSQTPLKITNVYPQVNYSKDAKTFQFYVYGEGFSPVGRDHHLLLEGNGELPLKWTKFDGSPCAKENGYAGCGELVSSQEIHLWGLEPPAKAALVKLRIRVGEGQPSDPSSEFTLSRVSQNTPTKIAFVVVGLLVLLLFAVFKARGTSAYVVDGKKYGFFSMLFLDPETDTYSLSKFQFILWTAVAVFAYVYLMAAQSLVQGKLEFVDIPENLPGIVLVAAGTTVLASGITSSKGTKGAGDVHPSWADFISTGGILAPERLQFFVWTIVGVATFISLIVLSDPGTIHDLPKIPERFLYLMGVSSAGYLGGKLARQPGPIIDEIVAMSGSLVLEIRGRFLSRDASFLIDDQQVSASLIRGEKPEIVDRDPQASGGESAKVLRLTLDPANAEKAAQTLFEKWRTEKHLLTLINPDGQKAVASFESGGQAAGDPADNIDRVA
jgi:hypothetical protein